MDDRPESPPPPYKRFKAVHDEDRYRSIHDTSDSRTANNLRNSPILLLPVEILTQILTDTQLRWTDQFTLFQTCKAFRNVTANTFVKEHYTDLNKLIKNDARSSHDPDYLTHMLANLFLNGISSFARHAAPSRIQHAFDTPGEGYRVTLPDGEVRKIDKWGATWNEPFCWPPLSNICFELHLRFQHPDAGLVLATKLDVYLGDGQDCVTIGLFSSKKAKAFSDEVISPENLVTLMDCVWPCIEDKVDNLNFVREEVITFGSIHLMSGFKFAGVEWVEGNRFATYWDMGT